MANWPKIADDKPVLIDHFTPQQRIWLNKRARAGGSVWVLLQVGREFILMDGAWAAENLGHQSRSVLINGAWKYWPNGYDPVELMEIMDESARTRIKAHSG